MEAMKAQATQVAALAELLRETEEHHGVYEKTYASRYWSEWYAAYLSARQDGSNSEEATAIADHYMTNVLHILPL